jgi:hypothetical protein
LKNDPKQRDKMDNAGPKSPPPSDIDANNNRHNSNDISSQIDALMPTEPEERDALAAIWRTLRAVVGVDFTQYRRSTVMRRLTRQKFLQ